jgi:hypothetical protein
MSFRLHIGFTGLCMFVPEPATKQMHVLLPNADSHAGHIGQHLTRLYYDKGYLSPGGGLQDHLKKVELDHKALVVPAFDGTASLGLPRQVVDITSTAGPLDGKQVLDRPKGVKSRVTLGSGRITYCAPGAYWDLGGRHVCMTNLVIWTVDVPHDSITLPLERINNGNPGALDTLFPIDGQVFVKVFNALLSDLPGSHVPLPTPPLGHKADHFIAYYEMSTGMPNPAVPVLLDHVGNCPTGTEDPCDAELGISASPADTDARKGADPHRCMVSGGTLG